MADITSKFQYLGNNILKIQFEKPEGNRAEKAESLNYYAAYKAEYKNDRWIGEVTIGFQQLNNSSEASTVLYEIMMVGKFTYAGDNSEAAKQEFVQFLKISGAGTLIPIARAAIVSVCAISGFPGIYTIPNINVYGLSWADQENHPSETED